jgi:hypothetical protein
MKRKQWARGADAKVCEATTVKGHNCMGRAKLFAVPYFEFATLMGWCRKHYQGATPGTRMVLK